MYTVHVPMCCRDDLLMSPPLGHLGWWAIQKEPPTVGDDVEFICAMDPIARGVITKVVPAGADHVSGEEWRNWIKVEWKAEGEQ